MARMLKAARGGREDFSTIATTPAGKNGFALGVIRCFGSECGD
jgi:hypothetical protein